MSRTQLTALKVRQDLIRAGVLIVPDPCIREIRARLYAQEPSAIERIRERARAYDAAQRRRRFN